MKNVIKPLAKSVLIPLELTAAASAVDAGIRTKILVCGTITLIIPSYEVEDIMKMVKPLEGSGLLLKELSETIQNEAKKQKGGFLSILSDTLGSSLLGNMIWDKGIIRARYGSKDLESKKEKGIIKASFGSEDF